MVVTSYSCGQARLGFDLMIVSSRFHVFEYGKVTESESVGVSTYSSNTATWVFKEFEWGKGILVSTYARSVCFLMALCTSWSYRRSLLLMQRKAWRKICIRRGVYAISIHKG